MGQGIAVGNVIRTNVPGGGIHGPGVVGMEWWNAGVSVEVITATRIRQAKTGVITRRMKSGTGAGQPATRTVFCR